MPLSAGIARGDVGKVTVHADQFERNGLELSGARAVYRGVQLHLSDLVRGDVRLRYASVNFQGTLTQAALRAYLKPLLASRGVSGEAPGGADPRRRRHAARRLPARHRAGEGHRPVVDPADRRERLGARSCRRSRRRSSSARCPMAWQLTGIVLSKGQATIVGRGEAGTIRA